MNGGIMHRNQLISLLNNYRDDIETRDRILKFVREHSSCFERQNSYGHITSSSWLLSSDLNRVLLTHHRKLDKWLQPGGHCDGESDVPASALREAVEESGIEQWDFLSADIFDLDIHLIPARKNDPEHFHFDVRFAFRAAGSEEYTVSEESHDLAWVPLTEIQQYTEEDSILRMVNKTNRFLALN